ncbi:MAG: replication protein RepA [Cyanobacteria bacterium P01_A01_bin.17]
MTLKPPTTAPSSRHFNRLLDAAAAIATDPETAEQDKAFLTRQLVQVTLPHSSPGNIPIWKRTNGNLTLSIRPGWNHECDQPLGLPFGSIPRLLLFWITTEALRNNSRKLHLGDTLAGFVRDVGLNPETGGGKRSDSVRIRNQMERLFRATISLDISHDNQTASGKSWLDMQIAPKGELWWDFKSPEQGTLFGSWIELGEQFYNAIITAPVPLDKRALNALKRSPLALDLYAWATYKSFVLSQGKKKYQFIPWCSFMLQMGADYSDIKNFKRKAKVDLRRLNAV